MHNASRRCSSVRPSLVALAVLAWAHAASPLHAGVIGSAQNPANGHTYYLLDNNSWTASQAEAVTLGGNLATVRDQAEHDWIRTTFGSWGGIDRYLWIGLNDVAVEGQFVWVSGEPVVYTNWNPGEPNNEGGVENYVSMQSPAFVPDMLWNDDVEGSYYNGLVEIVTYPPSVTSISPTRARYDDAPTVTIQGANFTIGGPISVRFGALAATNVVVLDDATLTCAAPLSAAGPVDIGVSSSDGEGVLASGFTFTPAITIEGDVTPGGSITIHYLFDPGDGVLAIYGLPPAQPLPVPPYDGELCILPFNVVFFLPSWPFNRLDVDTDLPNDPALVGLDVLLQALVGPQLTKQPKDGAWSNCATLAIR